MGTTQEEPTLKELVSRLAALEQAHALLLEKLESSSGTAPAAKPSRPGVFTSDVAGTPAVSASGTNGADGVDATSDSGTGVSATSGSGTGLIATSSSGLAGHFVGNVSMSKNLAIVGTLSSGAGTFASGVSNTPAVTATGANGADGMDASSDSGFGARGDSNSGVGLIGTSQTGDGIHGFGSIGVFGQSDSGTGINGLSASGIGVRGDSNSGDGIHGQSSSGNGVSGFSSSGTGISGNSPSGIGVFGGSTSSTGVFGSSGTGTGVLGLSSGGLAGQFQGDVQVTGNLNVGGTLSKGGGSFRIDHPLDPAHKYLSHSFVESPDMKNIYDGVVTLDAHGEAEVRLPAWFDALNTDFRYQLTCLGGYAPVYIAEKICGNRFKIAGGQAGMEVSWLVTGIRQDAWAYAHRMPVEQDKPAEEQGSYLHPDLYGESEQKRIGSAYSPEMLPS